MLVGPYSNYGLVLIMSAAPVGTAANVKLMRWICSLTVVMKLFGRQHNLMFGGSYSKPKQSLLQFMGQHFPG